MNDDFRKEGLGDDVDGIGGRKRDVLHLGVEGDGERCGQRPRGGRPDDGVNVFLAGQFGGDLYWVAGESVADVDAGRGVILILDFRLGEGGAVVNAPGDWLEAFVDEAVLEEVEEGLGDARLVLGVHGGVGLFPAAEATQANELLTLQVEVLLGVLAAGAADGNRVHLKLLAAELLVDFDLDGETVAVPAGNVGGVEASHGFRLDDEVLQRLVQGVAQVDGAIGVGRAIVQNVAGRASMGGADLGVKIAAGLGALGPRGEAQGLVQGQIGLHGEGGLRKVQGGFERLWLSYACGLRFGCFGHSFLVVRGWFRGLNWVGGGFRSWRGCPAKCVNRVSES